MVELVFFSFIAPIVKIFRIASLPGGFLVLSTCWRAVQLLSHVGVLGGNGSERVGGPQARALSFAGLGGATMLVALIGPLRVGFSSAMIPLQIKQMLRVLGTCLVTGGVQA